MKKLIIAGLALLAACSGARRVPFAQYSVAMNLTVEADSSVFIGTDEKFNGVLWINDILRAEQTPAKSVSVIENYGKLYVCTDQFKNVWIVTPHKDGLTASCKALDVTPDDETDAYSSVGFSRYGSRENAAVRFRFSGRQIFIDKKGKVHENYQ
jgi:hypothetical protein